MLADKGGRDIAAVHMVLFYIIKKIILTFGIMVRHDRYGEFVGDRQCECYRERNEIHGAHQQKNILRFKEWLILVSRRFARVF